MRGGSGMRPGVALFEVWSPLTMYRILWAEQREGLPLRSMLTRETCVWSVVNLNKWNGWYTWPKREGVCAWLLTNQRGVSHAHTRRKAGKLRIATTRPHGTGELWYRLTRKRGARMPACGTEGGGSVVAKRHAVMVWTGWRSARERRLTRGRRDEVRKADDGWSSDILFSSIVGVVMRRVVPCSNWCASLGKPQSTTSNARTREVTSSTGKPDAVKVACPVWTGGKGVSSYLSVLRSFWSLGKPASKFNGKAIESRFPVMDGHLPFFGDVLDRQINDLKDRLVRGKDPVIARHLA